MKIKEVDIISIRPYWRNPRINSKAVESVKSSIRKYKMNQPILVDSNGVIIAGHTRYQALVQLGYKKVYVIFSDLTEMQAKEFRIIDNKTSEIAEWDMDKLVQELREINLEEVDEFFIDVDLTEIIENFAGANESKHHKDVTADDVKEAAGTQSNRFEENNKVVENDMLKAMCPHCGEEFLISRKELSKPTDEDTVS
jgi:ParB-like chromosome segregation protein Spo0J